ncbi:MULTISPECIES: hypothetical protein [Cytobacillus]|uniref:hypothetical protein n=1 Tax=Cytobacillus TaxID=2675230 RepID=UPI00203BBB1C|nr:hypothetical protein [Cytobacillus firmus]
MDKPIKAKDCSNLAKEYNDESNLCLLRDAHCHLLVKHERYCFDKKDLACSYLSELNASKQEARGSSKRYNGCREIFKTNNLRLRYCSDTCRRIARRKSENESRAYGRARRNSL